ncbi:MAG: hypothetical protein RLZZ271_1022, partial [Pseudomonadota bacterium]
QLKGRECVPVVRRPCGVVGEHIANDEASWMRAVQSCDSVVHLAARAHVMSEELLDPLAAYRLANVQASVALAECAARAGVRRFVFISSIKVNGESTAPATHFTPEDKPAPVDPYGISKWEAEQALRGVCEREGMELVVIRPPLVYGPGVKGNFASMLNWVKRGMPLPLGCVHNQRSMVGLDNLVDLLALCADPDLSPAVAGRVLLVKDEHSVSTPDLLRAVAKACGVSCRLMPVPTRLMRMGAALVGKSAQINRLLGSLTVDDSATRELLNWTPPYSMEEQLERMVNAAPL